MIDVLLDIGFSTCVLLPEDDIRAFLVQRHLNSVVAFGGLDRDVVDHLLLTPDLQSAWETLVETDYFGDHDAAYAAFEQWRENIYALAGVEAARIVW